jgi:uncharacterized MnhB-related membrane protein
VIGWLQTGVLLLVAVAGAGVVLTRDPLRQSIAVSFYGLVLALMFFLHQAPDVALSQIVVGAVALPLMILLALARIREDER